MTDYHSRSQDPGRRPGRYWLSWLDRILPSLALTPLRITLTYLALGFLALYVSDVLMVQYLRDPLLSQAQALKGAVEVVLTGGLILLLTTHRETQLERSRRDVVRQREELQVLHRVLRHNLRNDITVILGYADYVRQEASDGAISNRCEKIIATAEDITRYTEKLRMIHQITEENGATRTEDLGEMIPNILDRLSLDTESVVETDFPESAIIEVNPMFENAVEEALRNAILHNDSEDPAVSIEVDPDEGPSSMVCIRISDNGPGIPRDELKALEVGGEDQLLHLSGVGLWFVNWTVRNSGGYVEFDSDDGGTTVSIYAPIALEMLSPPILRTVLE